ncbi:MAG TPA: YXWGXW repeat-containing protein [Chryseolinea sp.]|nr:YXWGXW repeat-containing protein [Chryseolinea sp.]
MKNLIIITVLTLITSCASPSRVVVRETPAPPVVVVRPAPPYQNAVWIGDSWRWRHGRYVYVKPHYIKPRRGMVWVDGHWKNTPRRFVWVKGHWR